MIKRFSCTIGPLGRSAISKIIPPDDLGFFFHPCTFICKYIKKYVYIGDVFAFTTSLETIVQIISTPLYTLLYNNTISIYPGVFNFLSAILNGINIFVVRYYFLLDCYSKIKCFIFCFVWICFSAVILLINRYPNEDLHIG